MAAVQGLYCFLGINSQTFSKEEILILEAELFLRLCSHLREIIREQNKEYFFIIKLNVEKEDAMIEANFIRCIIQDILSTEEYNLPGIACYTDTPEDVIYEVAAGCNARPTLMLARKIIELHRNVRPDLYRAIFNKMMSEFK